MRRAFLDGDWDVFAGQYFDRFDPSRHVTRAETIDWKPWWPRWISIDWGFEHPAAAYWHAAAPGETPGVILSASDEDARRISAYATLAAEQGTAHVHSTPPHTPVIPRPRFSAVEESAVGSNSGSSQGHGEVASKPASRVVTYREYVTHRTAPRELAREIIARSQTAEGEREKIDAIYLSPDAFARRTDEASIAEQMGDVFAAAGFPRPIPADNDRVGGWMLMYQMLDAGEWLLTENCIELIRTLPNLVRDPARVEDIEKMDGDDPADAARYGLKSRYGVRRGAHEHLPLEQRLAALITSPDPTIRAIQARKAQLEQSHRGHPISFLHRRR